MNLEEKIMGEMKEAMKSKNEAILRSLRGIKAEIIKAKTEPGAGGTISEDKETALLQKMVKQRRDSLRIYQEQNRSDLAQKEQEELDTIERFLPARLSEEELRMEIKDIISQTGAVGPSDMGKVMGVATKQLAGKADGKEISALVKDMLANQ